MRFPRRRLRRGPHLVATLPSSLRHAALLVAVVGTVTLASPLVSPSHADATTEAVPSIAARVDLAAHLDGRLPDGAPSSHADATVTPVRTLLALTAATPAATTTAAPMRTVAVETPMPTAVAFLAIPALQETVVPTLTRLTATPTPAPQPIVKAAVAPPPVPSRYATIGELNVALAQTPWPAELWPSVVAVALCESGVDRDRDGRYDAVDTQASGAGGRYIGALQIGAAHRFNQPYDLHSLVGNLAAGYELWAGAGGSFAPWGCH